MVNKLAKLALGAGFVFGVMFSVAGCGDSSSTEAPAKTMGAAPVDDPEGKKDPGFKSGPMKGPGKAPPPAK